MKRLPTRSHLVAKSPTSAMDHYAHLAYFVDAHFIGREFVVDFLDHLDLGVVVAGSQGTQLRGL